MGKLIPSSGRIIRLASPQVRHHTHSVSTKAYAVQVVWSADSTAHVLQVLQTLLVCATPEFVPCNTFLVASILMDTMKQSSGTTVPNNSMIDIDYVHNLA